MPGTSRKAARAARMARFLELKLFFMFVSSLFFSCIWRFRVPPSLRDAQIRKKRDQKSPVRCIIHGMLRLLPRWLCLAAICAAPVVAGTICVTDTLAPATRAIGAAALRQAAHLHLHGTQLDAVGGQLLGGASEQMIRKIGERSRAGGSRGAQKEFTAVDHGVLLCFLQKIARIAAARIVV